jgi:NAD(P)-dependent dehydrogenase (short-subunit alcohol dehydrogenase family)
MTRDLADSVVVITGASSGIGRASALRFAGKGASVVLNARREWALQEVARQCEALGARALVVPGDVRDRQAMDALARRALEAFGRIDVWVNDAAVTAFGRFEEIPPEVYDRVVETNLLGYANGARAALRAFREQGSGVLINLSSVVGTVGQPYATPYVATKWAIRGFAESLRMELSLDGDHDIHVCTVLPGSVDTPLFQNGANYSGRAVRPMPPIYDADEIAAAIVDLARNPKREHFVGGQPRMMAMQRRMTPTLFEKMFARQVDRTHFQDRAEAPSTGNVFEPSREWAGVSGEWKQPGRSRAGLAALPALALGGLAAWGLLRSESVQDLARTILPDGRRRGARPMRILRPVARALPGVGSR